MTTLYYNKATPTSTSATGSSNGYPPDNVNLQAVTRPWRSASTGVANDVVLNIATLTIASLLLQDVNFLYADIFISTDGATYGAPIPMTTYQDKKIPNRRKGLAVINTAGVKIIRIRIYAGVPGDALAYWRIGAAYAFQKALMFSTTPLVGSSVKAKRPLVSSDLSNGIRALAVTGAQFNEISITLKPKTNEDLSSIITPLQAGVCGIDFNLSPLPEMVYAVCDKEAEITEAFSESGHSDVTLMLIEAV